MSRLSVPARLPAPPGVSIRNGTRIGAACCVVAGPWMCAPQTDPSISVQSIRTQTRSSAGTIWTRAVPTASGSPQTVGGAQAGLAQTSWSPVSVSLVTNARCDAAPATATVTSSNSTAESTARAAVDRRMVMRGSSLGDSGAGRYAVGYVRLPSAPMPSRRCKPLAIVGVAILLSACLSDQPSPSPSSAGPVGSPTAAPSPTPVPTPTPVPEVDVPLAVITGYTAARADITLAEVQAAADTILVPCEVTAFLDRTLDRDRDCLSAARGRRAAAAPNPTPSRSCRRPS